MAHLIDKDALVAETKRLRENRRLDDRHDQGVLDALHAIERFIDSLEVKEVDLEEEIKRLWEKHSYLNMDWLRPIASFQFPEFSDIAKYFFELGLSVSNKAQKGDKRNMSKAEKFIQECTSNCSNAVQCYDGDCNPCIIYKPWLTPDQARRAVEIAREEELEYIKYQLELRLPETLDYNGVQVDREDFINDFIKAMKDE